MTRFPLLSGFAIWPDWTTEERFGLFLPLGNPPDWLGNTVATFTLSSKVARTSNDLLGRHWPRPWVTVPVPAAWWTADGTGTCEFFAPATTSGTFRTDGTGTCEFTPEYIDSFFWAHGAGGNEWTGFSDLANGFEADGTGTCEFFISATSLKMQGTGGATFQGASQPAPTGFKAQGSGGARFFGGVGIGEDCLTSKDTLPGGPVPNFVY